MRLLADELGADVTRDGTIQGFALTIKSDGNVRRPMLWARAVEGGRMARSEPLAFYRHGGEWRALIRRVAGDYRDASFAQAVLHVREKLACWP